MLDQIDPTLFLLPLLCCLFALISQGRQQPQGNIDAESWFIPENMDEVYRVIIKEVDEWNRKSRQKKSRFSFGRGKEKERFTIIKSSPRLCEILDRKSGPIFFEMIEVEGGGAVVKVTYNPIIKNLIADFKTRLPLRIPARPVGKNCPSCGKPVLKEFNVCPYCGEKLTIEGLK